MNENIKAIKAFIDKLYDDKNTDSYSPEVSGYLDALTDIERFISELGQ